MWKSSIWMIFDLGKSNIAPDTLPCSQCPSATRYEVVCSSKPVVLDVYNFFIINLHVYACFRCTTAAIVSLWFWVFCLILFSIFIWILFKFNWYVLFIFHCCPLQSTGYGPQQKYFILFFIHSLCSCLWLYFCAVFLELCFIWSRPDG